MNYSIGIRYLHVVWLRLLLGSFITYMKELLNATAGQSWSLGIKTLFRVNKIQFQFYHILLLSTKVLETLIALHCITLDFVHTNNYI